MSVQDQQLLVPMLSGGKTLTLVPVETLRCFDASDLFDGQLCGSTAHYAVVHTNLGGPSGPATLITVYSDFEIDVPVTFYQHKCLQSVSCNDVPSRDGRLSAYRETVLCGGGDAIVEPMRETDDDDAGEFVFGSEYEDGEVAEDEEDATLLPP